MWDLDELIRITGARMLRRPLEQRVRPVFQAEELKAGDLFFPLSQAGITESLYETLASAGAAGVVIFTGQQPPCSERFPYLGVLEMQRPMSGFYRLGTEARKRSQALIVGVTGTSGKSSTKEFLAHLLRDRYSVQATYNSRNTRKYCAKILMAMDGKATEAAVLEMGFDDIGDVDAMAAMAQPFAGVITKVTPAHLEGAGGSLETVAREKGKMGLHVPPHGFMVLNGEDPGSRLIPVEQYRCRIYTFGSTARADAWYEDVQVSEEGTRFTLRLDGKRLACRLQACSAAQPANATAAALTAFLLGMAPAEIADRLTDVQPLPRRFAVHRFTQGVTVIDDTFNSNFDAACRGLESAAKLAGRRRRIAVMTGLARLVDQSPAIHRMLGRHAAECGFGTLVLVGDEVDMDSLRDGALEGGISIEHIHMVRQKEALAETLMPLVRSDTLVYLKARMYAYLGAEVDRFRRALVSAGFGRVR